MFEHLFTETVRRTIDSGGYGAWRSVASDDAAALQFGFPCPDSFPNDELVASARAVFEREGDVALQYSGGSYAEGLADVVAERARERGIECDAGDVVLTNGSTHAIDVVCRTFVEPGDALFVEAPTFMGALKLFEGFGADVTGIQMDTDGLDVEALADDLAARRESGAPLPKLLYTIPTFHNPTGTTLTLARRERLLDLAVEYDFVVLEDDAYGDLRYDGEDVPPLAALDTAGRVVRVGTFSKTIAPGVRTGWAIADDEIATQLDRMNAGGTNTFTQGVVGHYCRDPRFAANVADLRAAYERRRDEMLDALAESMPAGVEWTDPDGGFFVWVTVPEGVDTAEMLPDAIEAGVIYLPGEHFYPDERGGRTLRLSFSYASSAATERGIEALGRAIEAEIEG